MNLVETDKIIPTPRSLLFEYYRLKTFNLFPGQVPYESDLDKMEILFDFVKPLHKKLAKRGYYYDRMSNSVRCYFCPSILTKKEHYAEASTHENDLNCKMFLYPLNGNVPLKNEGSDPKDFLNQINDFLQKLVTSKEIFKVINDRTVIDFDKRLVRSDAEILFPDGVDSNDLSKYEVRLVTYDPWFPHLKETEIPDKKKYAKAGFVYTGFADIVMCFSCKKGLFNLQKIDEPEKFHMEFYKSCPFVRENYLSSKENSNKSVTLQLNDIEPLLWSHPLIKNLLFRDYGKSDVKSFFTSYLNCYGCLPIDVESCLEYIEEEKIVIYQKAYRSKN